MFVFGILLLASWAGWGAAIERLVVGRTAADRALHTGWGMAFTVLVGGILNLVGAISPAAIHVFLGAGLALLAWDGWCRRTLTWSLLRRSIQRLRRSPLLALAALVIGAMLVQAYAARVCTKTYNVHDDLQAYFVFPAKMIQTGTMGPDPFSEARLLSLGGMSFLQTIVLSVADARYFRLLEPGVALPLAVALLLGVTRDARASPWVAALVAFLFLAVRPPAANAASLVTGLVLFLTLFRTLWRVGGPGGLGRPGSILVAVVASALCALKTTHVPACALMVVSAYLLRARQDRSRAMVGELLLAGGLTLVFMAPWMLASYDSNGTLLYPILGRGFHGSAYGGSWAPYERPGWSRRAGQLWEAATDLKVVPLWVLAGGLLLRRGCPVGQGSLASFSLAALASFLALAGIHPGAYRYSWAAVWAATLTLLVFSCRETALQRRGGWSRVWPAVPVLVALGILILEHGAAARRDLTRQPAQIKTAVRHSLSPSFKGAAVRSGVRMLEAVPEGAVLLARLRYPFVLDFTRHTVLIANYPGGSSPPPGMPFFQGGEPLARYLCAQSVRYVAYSYRKEANFPRKLHEGRLDPGVFSWTRAQARHALDFQDNLMELGQTRRRIFDNGDVFVLDLGVSPQGEDLGCGPS